MTLATTRSRTILDHLLDGVSLGLPTTVRVAGSGNLTPVGLDNGNGQTKIALLGQRGDVCSQTIPTVYRTAREVRGGMGITSYRVNDGSAFWIGAEALVYDGDALPIGTTSERLGDGRQRDFLAAVLVESLIAAGHRTGIHNLAVSLAIQNDEIVLKRNGDGLGVSKETRAAIREYLYGKTFMVERIDSNGHSTGWTLTYSTILPQAQSIGTYLVWSRQPNGQTVDDGIEALTIIDIGTGDLQRTDIDVLPRTLMPCRMTGLDPAICNGRILMCCPTACSVKNLAGARSRWPASLHTICPISGSTMPRRCRH